ncbi:MAG: 6-hydroxymethylpterin diphosphokinase MptE-like protein [Candidatus Melainabacteria bacterium]|nr:6-hydroxymethylpterin diphosphokinase MptE-like protein [Candidatus Melainabacteria bacterium]
MYFETNCDALRKDALNHPVLKQLLETPPTDAVELVTTLAGDYSLFYKDCLLHSIEGAEQEAADVVKNRCRSTGEHANHIVLGFGLGYLVSELFQSSQGDIFVYENDLPLLRWVMENVKLDELLLSGRVCICTDPVLLIKSAKTSFLPKESFDILLLNGMTELYRDDLPILKEKLLGMAKDVKMDYSTLYNLSNGWLQEFFLNMPEFATAGDLDPLRNRYLGKPAVIISAGPSLDAAIEDIRAIQDGAVLIAIGSALGRLYKANIVPDYALFLDSRSMDVQFAGLPESYLQQISFINGCFTQNACFHAPAREKRVFLTRTNDNFTVWLDRALEKRHDRIRGGGSVAIVGFQMALLFGCSHIILTGQNLALQGDAFYAGGVKVQWLNDTHATNELYDRALTMVDVKGQNGEMLKAPYEYSTFIRLFELMAHELSQMDDPPRLINASVGGAQLNGYENLSLAQVREQLAFGTWKQTLPLAPAWTPEEVDHRRQQLMQALEKLLAGIDDGAQVLRKLQRQAKRILKEKSHPQMLRQLHLFKEALPEFNGFVEREAFLYSCFAKDTVAYFAQFENEAEGIDALKANFEYGQQYFQNTLMLLDVHMRQWITQARDTLRAQLEAGAAHSGIDWEVAPPTPPLEANASLSV